MVTGKAWRTAVGEYLHPRVVGVFFMGISSGFPLTLLLSSLGFWLIDEGVSKSTIGLLTLSLIPYFLKFIWAPALDSVRLPLLHKLLGRRRSWLIVIQIGLALAIFGLAMAAPGKDPVYFGLMAMMVCFMSASQDLVIDAYRIEILTDEEMPAGAAMTQFGYRVGNLIAGVVTLKFADWYGWDVAYLVMPSLLLFGLIPVLIFGEPLLRGKHLIEKEINAVRGWMSGEGHGTRDKIIENIYMTVIVPFKEFIQRRGWWVILLFI
ncbi:MAG: MFS transporter, partial [Emcibacter sp.]|nr:MFS transporter [Emcibacter sp.]